jgi:hypothetical protein
MERIFLRPLGFALCGRYCGRSGLHCFSNRPPATSGAVTASISSRSLPRGRASSSTTSRAESLSILLEQNASLAIRLVDYVHVVSKGTNVYATAPQELWVNNQIQIPWYLVDKS